MKIVIPSKGRPTAITTHLLFKPTDDYTIFVHNEEEYKDYRKNTTIPKDKLVNLNILYGNAFIRQGILQHVPKGEWFVTMDDNVRAITGVADRYYHIENVPINEKTYSADMRKIFTTPLTTEKFMHNFREMIEKAEAIGANFCGIGTTDNYFYRYKKWREVGFVCGKVALIKNIGMNFDTDIQCMVDWQYTAENLLRYGRVLINNFMFPMARHYQQGGIGTYTERLKYKKEACIYLMEKYPGLFSFTMKRENYGSELKIKYSNTEQVGAWRRYMKQRAEKFTNTAIL